MSAEFDAFLDGDMQEAEWDQQETEFDQMLCRHMIKKLKLQDYCLALQQEAGGTEPTVTDFCNHFESFPFRLLANRLTRAVPQERKPFQKAYAVHRCGLSREKARYQNFRKVPFVREYYAMLKLVSVSERRNRPVGMVFPRGGFDYGMVIHNDQSETFWTHESAWVYKGTRAHPDRLYVVSFTSLLQEIIDHGWTP